MPGPMPYPGPQPPDGGAFSLSAAAALLSAGAAVCAWTSGAPRERAVTVVKSRGLIIFMFMAVSPVGSMLRGRAGSPPRFERDFHYRHPSECDLLPGRRGGARCCQTIHETLTLPHEPARPQAQRRHAVCRRGAQGAGAPGHGLRPVIWPFGKRALPALDPASSARRAALSRQKIDLRLPLSEMRWCVVDVETGGLDPRIDPLLAIGAVTVTGNAIAMAPVCEVRLRQLEATATDNILVHGITTGQQLNGREPARALLDWLEYAGDQPRIAYHADFDRLALERASQTWLGMKDRAIWLDLAVLAPMLLPKGPGFNRPLDDWLAYFRISVYQRHGALADAYATAQLWLALLPVARAQKLTQLRQLIRFCRQARWLNADRA